MGLMSMLGIDPEKQTYDTVKDALTAIAEEYKCSYKDFFVMINPKDSEGNHNYIICKRDEKGTPTGIIREIKLKEILGNDSE